MDRLYGARLRAVREERGLRQVDVAVNLEMSAGGYSSIERGVARMFVADVPRYAEAMGVEVGYLSQRLGLHGESDPNETRAAECASLLAQLKDEPAEIVEEVLRLFRISIGLATARRSAQRN
jgi:transcriptional regulator with XRE-family HTH domain